METNLFVFIINHNTITGCKTMTSIVLQISKIQCKLSEVCSLNYASSEPEPVLTHLRISIATAGSLATATNILRMLIRSSTTF